MSDTKDERAELHLQLVKTRNAYVTAANGGKEDEDTIQILHDYYTEALHAWSRFIRDEMSKSNKSPNKIPANFEDSL